MSTTEPRPDLLYSMGAIRKADACSEALFDALVGLAGERCRASGRNVVTPEDIDAMLEVATGRIDSSKPDPLAREATAYARRLIDALRRDQPGVSLASNEGHTVVRLAFADHDAAVEAYDVLFPLAAIAGVLREETPEESTP